jgi:hypothetical protein
MADILALPENHDARIALLKICVSLRRKRAKGSRRKKSYRRVRPCVCLCLIVHFDTHKGYSFDNSLELFKICTVFMNVLFLDKRIFILYSRVFGMIETFGKSYLSNIYNNNGSQNEKN